MQSDKDTYLMKGSKVLLIADVPIEKGRGHYSYADVVRSFLVRRGHSVVVVSNSSNHPGFSFGGDTSQYFDNQFSLRRFRDLLASFLPDIVLFDTFPFWMFNQEEYKNEIDSFYKFRPNNKPKLITIIRDIWSWRDSAVESIEKHLPDFAGVFIRGTPNFWEDQKIMSAITASGVPFMHIGYIVEILAGSMSNGDTGAVVIAHQGGALPTAANPAKARQIVDFFMSVIDTKATLLQSQSIFRNRDWKLYINPLFPASERSKIEKAAGQVKDVSVVNMPGKSDYLAELRNASLLIGRAGYNTTLELMTMDTPRVIIPFVEPDCEQMFRARMLEQLKMGFEIVDMSGVYSKGVVKESRALLSHRLAEKIMQMGGRSYQRLDADSPYLRGAIRCCEAIEELAASRCHSTVAAPAEVGGLRLSSGPNVSSGVRRV